jgi:hypothetical protein
MEKSATIVSVPSVEKGDMCRHPFFAKGLIAKAYNNFLTSGVHSRNTEKVAI